MYTTYTLLYALLIENAESLFLIYSYQQEWTIKGGGGVIGWNVVVTMHITEKTEVSWKHYGTCTTILVNAENLLISSLVR